MAALDMSFEHGQPWDEARANFEAGVARAAAKYPRWVRDPEWNDDRTEVRLTGPGYDVHLRLDETKVHATGHVPVPLWLLEGPVRRFLKEAFAKGG